MPRIRVMLFVMTLFLTAACKKDDFSDVYVLDKMEFFNSSSDDLNNITIVGYEQGGEFKKIVDRTYYVTTFEEIENPYYDYNGYLNKDLRTDLDYKISFLSSGKTCEITEIKVKKAGTLLGGYSRSFNGFKVNGSDFNCQIIKIFPE